jgi:enoyl-[acyl-carrier protein] reductase I
MLSHHLLAGKRGLIFGAVDPDSLAWHVAEQCHAEGARFVLTNAPYAVRLGQISSLAQLTDSPVIECDATNVDDLTHLLTQTIELLGGKIDFILHAVAQSPNIRRKRTYDALNYNYFQQTLDISALSLHKLLQTAKQLDAIAEWGSVVALSYLAAERPVHNYVDMGDAKALLQSIARSFGLLYGAEKHVRINTIAQSPTRTNATKNFEEFRIMQTFTAQMAPLGNADADACAAACVMLFSDYTRFITMQNIHNDGGFAATGLSDAFMNNSKFVELRNQPD